ncbi:phosphotransferase [Microlunatus parietis]|uniref:Aminoglycoside phosphotransferase domain-containing protein n=1 Tax=Microlunatus parietis TaxID=682979 RepID=A0A7Y9ID27_9ACTN|nr:phosphotransferase [Microlunatus parietis]NYE74378.1 hypothetical protein [Microlunatus parietis]
MSGGSALITRWGSEAWRAQADNWIAARLADAGLRQTGPIEPARLRPWSVHLTVPTSGGGYWFKENCPPVRFEAGLVERLAQLVPGRVLEPLAVDADRGWLLTPDGGPTLERRDVTDETYGRVLVEYGELQRTLAGHRDDLVGTGLAALPVSRAAEHFEDQLRELTRLPHDHPSRVGPEVIAAAGRNSAVITEAARRLAGLPLPDSLQHNDVQPSNTVASPGGALRFLDFGDAVWSHPFCVLDVALHRIAQAWQCSRDDPRIRRLVERYVEGWTALAPAHELRELIGPALTVARLHRYNSWHRLIPYMPDDELRRHAGYPESLAGLGGAA